jgi:hypothetical protein
VCAEEIFGSKGQETPRGWKKLHNELHDIKMDLKGTVGNVRVCSGFNWLRAGLCGGLLGTR